MRSLIWDSWHAIVLALFGNAPWKCRKFIVQRTCPSPPSRSCSAGVPEGRNNTSCSGWHTRTDNACSYFPSFNLSICPFSVSVRLTIENNKQRASVYWKTDDRPASGNAPYSLSSTCPCSQRSAFHWIPSHCARRGGFKNISLSLQFSYQPASVRAPTIYLDAWRGT